MNQDLEKYQDIIEKLKPFVSEPDFNKILSQVAASVPNHKRFLLKMELKRLARPCTRVIDLRGRVSGECNLFEHDGITHFMDDIARDVFEQQVQIFNGYTLGVYEAVTNTENNYRVMHQKEKDIVTPNGESGGGVTKPIQQEKQELKEENFLVPEYCFANQTQRSEERMNFAVAIELFSEINKSIIGTTIDLSVSGMQFKTEQKDLFKVNEIYSVFFRGLENEYALDKRNGIPYKVVKIERTEDEQRIGLKRIEEGNSSYFTTFLEQFIRGNKRRYKVNIDNTLQAIKSKSYEQYYIPNFTSIPVYIEQHENLYSPRFILTNDCNKSSIYYWSNEHNELSLSYLINTKRLTIAIKKGIEEFYVYAFNNMSNDKVFFYSVSDFELETNPNILRVFQGFASRKASWRMYKVQLTKVTPDQSFRPLSLPNDIGDNVRKENQPPPPRLLSKLKHVTHMAMVTNVTDEMSTLLYQRYPVAKNHLPIIKKFGHSRQQPLQKLSMFRFKYQNLRVENRFQLRTPVIIKHLGVEIEGITDDVSSGGLCLELNAPFQGKTFSIIEAAFPKLQNMTRKYDLYDLPYEVRNISKDGKVINLKTYKEENDGTLPIAAQFFSELIKSNRSRLKADRDEEEFPGMGEALKNIYANNAHNIGFFIKKEGIHLIPDATTRPVHYNRLLELFSFGTTEPHTLNLYPLYCASNKDRDYLSDTLKSMRMTSKPVSRELYISFDRSKDNMFAAIIGEFADHFADEKEHQEFISKAVRNGRFFAIKIFIARTARPDTDMLRLEMSYVNMYAQHKAKSLEEDLWEVAGVGDIVDITDEAMRRCGFSKDAIDKNKGASPTALKELH